jgi:type I restriction enzyme, S subunit
MSRKFKPYPKYKDSGVEWVGNVPEHWEVVASKRRISTRTGGTSIKGNCSNEPTEGLYPAFSASGQDVWLEGYEYDVPGIVLSAVGARCGKTFRADGKWGVVANTHCLFPSSTTSRDFVWYITNQEDWWEKGGSAQPFIKVGDTLSKKWMFPTTLEEQQAIASFLDQQTSQIDEAIKATEESIELLQEERKTIISHAVTKGLDPKVKLKDSGIEWLGQVPEHWDIKRLKYLGDAITGLTYSPDDITDEKGGTLVLRSSNVQGGKIVFDDNVFVGAEIPEELRTREGDILICSRNGSRALIGKNATIDGKSVGLTWGAFMTVFRSPYSNYISCVLNSPLFEFQSGMFLTSTINQLTIGVLNNMEVPLPPQGEREAISTYLNSVNRRVDSLIDEKQSLIESLREYRSSLIHEAVTGKIDLREEAA